MKSLVQLIVSLEKRLIQLSDTLQKVRDSFMEKSADLEALQKKADDQVRQFKVGANRRRLAGSGWLHRDTNYYHIWVECSISFLMKTKSLEEISRQNVEKDREIASLKKELAKLSQKSPVQPKTKRSLLANIREVVTSPRKGTSGRTLRKTVRTPQHWKAHHLHWREFLFCF